MHSAARKRPRKALKITLIVIAALLLVLLAALAFAGNYFYTFALDPSAPGGFGSASEIEDNEDTRWLLSEARDVSLQSEDGLMLHAYRVEGDGSHRYAIICHGYQNRAANMAGVGRHFHDLGYTVLLPDARGHGESGGDYIGMGWPERRDVVGWASSIAEADPEARIVLYGVSMGAATVMCASGEDDLPENVACVVEDCGYTSVWDQFASVLYALYKLPPVPLLNALDVVCRVKAGYSIITASPMEQVRRSSTPTLFIHGGADDFVPFAMLDEVYNAAACEKEKLVVPGAGHAQSSGVDPALYWSTVDTFVEKHVH